MNNLNLKLLSQLLEADKHNVYGYLSRFLETQGYSVIEDGYNYIIGIPNEIFELGAPRYCRMALVAHMDTLAYRERDLVQIDEFVINRNGVLGADDRAGIYAILHLIQTTKNKPIVIFTNDEEASGKGVKQMIYKKALDPYTDWIDMFIELDRQGSDDYVYYSDYLPDEFHSFAARYGFEESFGSYSDVADLTDEYQIPHLNLSIGYYDQHKKTEYLNLNELEATIERVAFMINDNEIPNVKIDLNYFKCNDGWGDEDMTEYYRWYLERNGQPNPNQKITALNTGFLPLAGSTSGPVRKIQVGDKPAVITYQEGNNTYLVYDGQEYLVGQNREYVVDLKTGTCFMDKKTKKAMKLAGLVKTKKKARNKSVEVPKPKQAMAKTLGNIVPELGGSRSISRSKAKQERLIEQAELPWVRR